MNGGQVAIAGVGYSTVARRTGLGWRDLVVEAATAALGDAGLSPDQVDGMTSMGGNALGDAAMLGIPQLNWYGQFDFGAAFIEPAVSAVAAVASGFSHTCIAIRVITKGTFAPAAEAQGRRVPTPMGTDWHFGTAHGAGGPSFAGMMAQRHMADHGTTEEQFGAHAVAQRQWAGMNDDALLRDPLTIDDYLASRVIARPVRMLDCDYPCDAASAVVFTTVERARDLAKPPVLVESASLVGLGEPSFDLLDDLTANAPVAAARTLWARTDLGPADVDTAHLYDGFSIITFQWLEALGFCEPGGSGPFVESGATAPGGALPLNTDGGACNVGRRHGANYCIEAVRQLRGEAGERQVEGAEVSVWTNAVGYFGGAMLLTRG